MANKYAEHHRLVVNGSLGSGAETFSIGLRLKHNLTAADDEWADGDVQTYLDSVAVPAVTAFWQRVDTGVSPQAKLTEALLYQVRGDGNRDKDHIRAMHRFTTPVAGAGGGVGVPFQVAMVVTLEAAGTITLDGRYSRFFLPIPGAPVFADTGRIAPAFAAKVAVSAAKLVNALSQSNQGVLGSVRVVAAGSKHVRNNLPDEDGHINPITLVRVGDVLDTQRRRTNSMAELYSSAKLDDAAVVGGP